MMDVIALTFTDRRLLSTRFADHANSHRVMHDALIERGAADIAARLDALREIERKFDLDLGLVCHLYEHRTDEGRHPIERLVVEFITDAHAGIASAGSYGEETLWVLPDRVRQVRDLMQGHVVGGRE